MKSLPQSAPGASGRPSRGDGAAAQRSLREIFEGEESALLRYAFGLTGRREVAEEVVQDSFLQLHAHWDTVREPEAWLYRCVRNRALNVKRDARREVLEAEAGVHGAAPDAEAPDEALGRMEAAGHLRLLLSELEPADRELLELKYDEGLKYREISERTGLSVGNVGYRLHHVLKLLAAKLHHLGIDGIS